MDLQDPVCNVCVNQISDLEPEVDYRAGFQTVSEVVALPSTVPVKRESFFHCDPEEELSPLLGVISDCLYGEEDKGEQKLMKDSIKMHVNNIIIWACCRFFICLRLSVGEY